MLTQLLAMKRLLGPEHPEVAAVLVTLAKLRQSMAQPDAAERIWRRVLAVRERTLPVNDTTIAATLDGLADACGAQGRLADELEMRERSLAIREVAQGPDHRRCQRRTRVAELRQIAPPRVIDPAGTATQRVSSPHNAPRRRVAPTPTSSRVRSRPRSSPIQNGHACRIPAPLCCPRRIHGVAGRPHLGTRQPGVGRDARQARVGGGAVCAAAHGYPGGIRRVSGAVTPAPSRGSGAVVPEPSRVSVSCAEAGRASGAVVPEPSRVSGAVVPEAGRVSGAVVPRRAASRARVRITQPGH